VQYSGDFGDHDFSVDLGVRKVNFGMEESTSSGSLDAIERSGVTRYFVEGNNGRRLGAGSYHVGAYFDGNNAARKQKTDGVFYSFAVTNPERSSGPGGASSSPNNTQAYWADLGYSGFFGGDDANKYRLGVALSSIADAGGRTPTAGSDIKGFNLWGEVEFSNWKIAGEYLAADVDDGLGAGRDASPWGFWVQPSLSLTDTFEVVGRYSYTDSDDRGIKVSDGVRSAPASMTGDNLTELYLGMNYYFSGNDVKFQLGYVHGTAERNGVEESANGVRSQMQLNF
jgi:hypothetical protein